MTKDGEPVTRFPPRDRPCTVARSGRWRSRIPCADAHTGAFARWLALAMFTMTVVLGIAVPARAHAFLIRTSPQAGERLAASPGTLTLEFSDAVLPGSPRLSVRTAEGRAVAIGPVELLREATVIRASLPPGMRGVYLVSWQLVADDGHASLGEFGFAVGTGGQLSSASATTSTPVSWPGVAATWLLVAGLALALGGLASEVLVWHAVARKHQITIPRAPAAPALLLALTGAVWQLWLLVSAATGVGAAPVFDPRTWRVLVTTRPGALSAAAVLLVAYALWLLPLRRLRALALLPLLAMAWTIAFRGHSATSGTWWAAPANALHLTAAGLWAGALLHLVQVLRRTHRNGSPLVPGEAVRRYAALALGSMLVALAGGTAAAFAEFAQPAELLNTAYGRVLLLKLLLVAVALVLALVARRRGLAAGVGTRFALLRRLTPAEVAALLAVLGIAAVLSHSAPARTASAIEDLIGPAPLAGPVLRLASLAGRLAVYLAAARGRLEIQVIAPSGDPARGAQLRLDGRTPAGKSVDFYPRSCGPGCFTMELAWQPGLTRLAARVAAPGEPGGPVQLNVPWPPAPDDPALLARVVDVMRRQPEFVLVEQVSSGPGAQGARHEFRMSGRRFVALEPYAASGADDVRRIGGSHFTEITFYLPDSYIWYHLWIDRGFRERRAVIISPAHLIERRFLYAAPHP